jgi:hypothetical protein
LVTRFRDRQTRAVRLEKLDEDVAYDPLARLKVGPSSATPSRCWG